MSKINKAYPTNTGTGSAMDFFEHQDKAKASTRKFLILYAITVGLICIAVGLLVAGIVWGNVSSDLPSGRMVPMNTVIIGGVIGMLATALLIGLSTVYRVSELRGGGMAVAHALGGTMINPSTQDPDERRVLNVVEEMAIASGVPVPPVFMMSKENGINAFAAGYTPGDAVIGVTKGCVQGLTRDELQGVMAHEFSHILNGDMRLNIRMMGFLSGITILSLIGVTIVRTMPYTSNRRSNNNGGMALIIAGFVLMILGWVGTMCAQLLQASVSRQREFLADASAVQFTRNPDGIANALRRIGGGTKHAKIKHPRAQETGHMFFGNSAGSISMASSPLATHPPLKERITRINPQWDGTMLVPLLGQAAPKSKKRPTPRERINAMGIPGTQGIPGIPGTESVGAILPLLALSGMMTPAHIDHAQKLIVEIPEPLRQAAHDPFSGRAVVYALLLDRKDDAIRQQQLKSIAGSGDSAMARLVETLAPEAIKMGAHLRLPLLDMTLGALAQMSERQHRAFRAQVDVLIKMDKSVELFEWMTMGILTRHLDERFGIAKRKPVQYYSLGKLDREVSVLLSALAHAGVVDKKDKQAAQKAFELGAQTIHGIRLDFLPNDQAGLAQVHESLHKLSMCSNKLKRELLKAAALVCGSDQQITTDEAELLRAVADALGVPTPPLMPGQKLV